MRADARANRAAILDAARRLYAERGAAVPLSTVAKEADVGIATLYRHFPTAHDLAIGLLSDLRDRVVALCAVALEEMAQDPPGGWRSFAHGIAALQVGTWALSVVEVEAANGPPTDLLAIREQGLAATARVIAEAKRHGLVRLDADPRHVQVGLGAVTRPVPTAMLQEVPGLDDWLLETYLRGIAPGIARRPGAGEDADHA